MTGPPSALIRTLPLPHASPDGILQALALQAHLHDLGMRAGTDSALEHRSTIRTRVGSALALAKGRLDQRLTASMRNNVNRDLVTFVRESMETVDDLLATGPSRREILAKVSVAITGGDEYSPQVLDRIALLALRFSAVSVREDSGVDLSREHWSVKAERHVDPVVLLDATRFRTLVGQSAQAAGGADCDHGSVFAYVFDSAAGTKERIAALRSSRSTPWWWTRAMAAGAGCERTRRRRSARRCTTGSAPSVLPSSS